MPELLVATIGRPNARRKLRDVLARTVRTHDP